MSEPCATAPLTVFKEWPTAFQQPLKRPQDLHPALGGWRCGAEWFHKNSGGYHDVFPVQGFTFHQQKSIEFGENG